MYESPDTVKKPETHSSLKESPSGSHSIIGHDIIIQGADWHSIDGGAGAWTCAAAVSPSLIRWHQSSVESVDGVYGSTTAEHECVIHMRRYRMTEKYGCRANGMHM